MTLQELADALEGRREGREWRCRCPVHGGRSLSIRETEGRILLTCRAGCQQNEVITELKHLGLWGSEACRDTLPHPAPTLPDDTERKADRAADLWRQAHPIQPGDPVHQYLAGRGITLPEYPSDLRCHSALDYWEVGQDGKPVLLGKLPAMLAAVRNPQGRPVALHRTYVTNDGHKAPIGSPKKILKVHDLSGSTIRLFPPRDGFVAICEGVEDALSAWILWSIPSWATIGTSGLKGFVPPEGVREVLIMADNDEPGKKAALELAQRLEEKGKAVRIVTPSGPAKDINQLLMMECTR